MFQRGSPRPGDWGIAAIAMVLVSIGYSIAVEHIRAAREHDPCGRLQAELTEAFETATEAAMEQQRSGVTAQDLVESGEAASIYEAALLLSEQHSPVEFKAVRLASARLEACSGR